MIPKSVHRVVVAILLISTLSFLLPPRTQACGPFFTNSIFVYSKHPDFPLTRFAGGQLGVLQSSYARSYLVAAYRNLSGESLTETEIAALKGLWDDRLNNAWESHEADWIRKWNEARVKVPGVVEQAISVYRYREKPNEYESYLNCQQDAFEIALGTINDRITRFGADSPNVREWLKAQDIVFSNCHEGSNIPDAAPENSEASIRADRAYQIAAANFYAAHFDEAAKQFDSISRDASSPWRHVATYLAARSFLRKGSLAEKAEAGRPALAEAEIRLKAILNDKSLTRSHHAATRLLNLTRLRLRPEEKLSELARAVAKKGAEKDFKQAVWDYTLLLDKFVGDDDDVKIESVPEAIRSDELTDWILTFQADSDAATRHALKRWQDTKSAPWLLAAISKVKGSDPQTTELLAAAARVDHESSAFPSLVFHTVRLLSESNRNEEARSLLDRVLARERKVLTPSALNQLLGQRMMLAQNLGEFLQNAQRVPAGLSANDDGREIPDEDPDTATTSARFFFDDDAATVFNSLMPTATIAEAASHKGLLLNLHRDVAQAAFMRAALLGDATNANKAAGILASEYPEMKMSIAAYQQAKNPDARRFAAVYHALKFPGMRPFVTAGVNRTSSMTEIDSYRDNWWCAEPPTATIYDENGEIKRGTVVVPEFLKSSQPVAAREASALRALGTGPNYLCQTVINWATRNPGDARVPEALHLAVKSTRYGCTDKETGRWSKAAFDLLHRRYANSSWAKETKYWFKG